MKLVVQVKLLPTPEQASALEATLRTCNRAATYASQVAFAKGLKDRNGLQKEVYTDLKATFGLSAQPAVRAVKNNRPARDHFRCRRCGLAGPADVVAGVNVRDRARSAWAFVTMPVPHPV
ncbi:hypothetical protein [Streptomyces cavernae]|uniref:hypothetical protein n=1 Tax=Streptomyces cavernae TaxID=2259034 RepID=UPI00192E3AE6|nr:hypothetical protein [Streptomyces cavernae]